MMNNKLTTMASNSSQNNKNKKPQKNIACMKNDAWPRFLVIKPNDENTNLKGKQYVAICKAIVGMAGEPKSSKVLYSGSLLVEMTQETHSKNLLKTKSLANIPVEVSPHRSFNSSKFIIFCRQISDMEEDEIKEELKPQGITAVQRRFAHRDGQKVPLDSYILTINSPNIPPAIKIGFMNCPTEIYIPNPLRCFQCQKYGHGKRFCNRKAICAKCGHGDHSDDECTNDPFCVNCNGNHPAFSRNCPVWKSERSIVSIKFKENISFKEARLRVEGSRIDPSKLSYAAAASPAQLKTKHNKICQTDFTWPLDSEVPIRFEDIPDNHTPNQVTHAVQTDSPDEHLNIVDQLQSFLHETVDDYAVNGVEISALLSDLNTSSSSFDTDYEYVVFKTKYCLRLLNALPDGDDMLANLKKIPKPSASAADDVETSTKDMDHQSASAKRTIHDDSSDGDGSPQSGPLKKGSASGTPSSKNSGIPMPKITPSTPAKKLGSGGKPKVKLKR